ncbi:hypothetical protein BDV98DRAFT_574822 [Pterulicium gracile]|uniref:Uncharacterized protein n=1 Tax=Pterulicium gracile TaxID=1884261 RepID=A0A5C3Q7V5_9AGAR|nr:hypothetical protein BDV98DRAFT_574822 [Pterula gracilis]
MISLKAVVAAVTVASSITLTTGAALRLCQVDFFPTGINIGVDNQMGTTLAWVNGTSKCDTNSTSFAMINPTTDASNATASNACGTPFSLDGISGYTLEGCDTDTQSLKHDGQPFATCQTFSEEEAEEGCNEGFYDFCTPNNGTTTIDEDPCAAIDWTHKCEAILNEGGLQA